MKPSEPRFAIDEAVWVNHSNTDNGWYSGVVAHILRYDDTLQNGQTPDGNLYIVEIRSSIEPYFDMFPSGRLHRIPHCRRHSTVHGEHDCLRDVHGEINAINIQIELIQQNKKKLLRAEESLAALYIELAALENQL